MAPPSAGTTPARTVRGDVVAVAELALSYFFLASFLAGAAFLTVLEAAFSAGLVAGFLAALTETASAFGVAALLAGTVAFLVSILRMGSGAFLGGSAFLISFSTSSLGSGGGTGRPFIIAVMRGDRPLGFCAGGTSWPKKDLTSSAPRASRALFPMVTTGPLINWGCSAMPCQNSLSLMKRSSSWSSRNKGS